MWDDLVPEEADTKDEDGDDLDANMHDNTDDAMDDAALPSADDMDRDAEEFGIRWLICFFFFVGGG